MRPVMLASSLCLVACLSLSASAADVTIKEGKILQNAIAISPDFRLYVEKLMTFKRTTGATEYSLKVKATESGEEVKALEWEKEWRNAHDAHFSPDGRWLSVMAGDPGQSLTAKVYDLQTGEMRFNVRQHQLLKFVLFGPDSKHLASAGGFGAADPRKALWVWDLSARRYTVMQAAATPTCMAFSPNGKLIAAAAGRYYRKQPALTVCNVASGKRVWQLQVDEDLVAIAFSSDSKMIAVGDRHGIIKILDVATHKEVASFDDLQDEVFSLAFHPKQKLLAATGKDKTIRFWDVEDKRLVSTTKLPKLDYFLRLQFATDGKQLATITVRGDIITIWIIVGKE